jgi:hypothetical protein
MMGSFSALSIGLAAIVNGATTPPKPCVNGSDVAAVRQVQESDAFRGALTILANTTRQGTALSSDDVRYICVRLRKMQVVFPESLTIVYVPGFEALEVSHMIFGVTPARVLLLTEVTAGKFTPGVDIAQWNRFAKEAGLGPLRQPPEARSVACLIYSMYDGLFPNTECESTDPSTVTRAKGYWKVAIRASFVCIRDDGTVIEIADARQK